MITEIVTQKTQKTQLSPTSPPAPSPDDRFYIAPDALTDAELWKAYNSAANAGTHWLAAIYLDAMSLRNPPPSYGHKPKRGNDDVYPHLKEGV